MMVFNWLSDNYIEVFGAVTGILYVFLEIRQNILLWPVGIITSAVYIWVFFTSKFYADGSLQCYYLIISCLGWLWWMRGGRTQLRGSDIKYEKERGREGEGEQEVLKVTRVKKKTAFILAIVFLILYAIMWLILSKLTDSPVPVWDAFITSLSVVATWMLARKIFEHWFLWIVVNFVSAVIFIVKGLYPTVVLYLIYGIMSFIGLTEWKKTISKEESDERIL